MKYTLKKLPPSLVEIDLHIPYEDLEKAKGEAAQMLSSQVRVPGFRKGKVPLAVLERHIGTAAIIDKALDIVIQQSYVEVVKKESLAVVDRPEDVEIKKYPEREGEQVEVVLKVPVLPEVKIGDYKKSKVKKERATVEEKEIDEVITHMTKRFAEHKKVDRPAAKGDRLEIDFEGSTLDGVLIDGASSKHHPLNLGEGGFIPGFEEALEGLSAGEDKEFTVTFPKDYHAAHLADKPVKFKVKAHLVEELVYPVVDADFTEKVRGKKMSVTEFRDTIREDLKREKETELERQYEEQLIDELISKSTIELPEALVKQEIDLMLEEFKDYWKKQGVEFEHWLEHAHKTEEELKDSWKASATRRVQARLILQELVKLENITVSESEMESEIAKILSRYQNREHLERVRQFYAKGGRNYRELEAKLKLDKVFQLLKKGE